MVATFRCDQIAKETLSRLNSDKAWLALRKDAQARPEPKFRERITSILENTLSQYDMEAIHFEESIRDDKRKELETEALQVLYPAYAAMLRHLRSRALQFFKTRLITEVKRATKAEFEASIDSIIKDTMDKFEEESRDVSIRKEWDASVARQNLFSEIKTMTVEAKTKTNKVSNTLMAKVEKGLAWGMLKLGIAGTVAGSGAVAMAGAGAGSGAVAGSGAGAVAVAGAGAGESLDNSDTANDLVGETFDNSPDCEITDDLEGEIADDLADDNFVFENDSLDWGDFILDLVLNIFG